MSDTPTSAAPQDLPASELMAGGRFGPLEAATESRAVWLARVRQAFSVLVALTAVTVLGSYPLGWHRVASLSPDWAATSLLLLSLCGWLPRRTARIVAVVPCVVAAATLVEYTLGADWGFDPLGFSVRGTGPYPARMSVVTAVCLLLLAIAQLCSPGRSRSRRLLVEGLALAVAVVSALALLGYLYGVSALYSVGPYASTALLTAASLQLLRSRRSPRCPRDQRRGWSAAQTPAPSCCAGCCRYSSSCSLWWDAWRHSATRTTATTRRSASPS